MQVVAGVVGVLIVVGSILGGLLSAIINWSTNPEAAWRAINTVLWVIAAVLAWINVNTRSN